MNDWLKEKDSANWLRVHEDDNVMVALQFLEKDRLISYNNGEVKLVNEIQGKQKFLLVDRHAGDEIIMYGSLVGRAKHFLSAGSLLTIDNVGHAIEPYQYRGSDYQWTAPDNSRFSSRTFNGYVRSDGRVGTANYWLFIPTVFCENRNLDVIRESLQTELGYSVTGKYKKYARDLISHFRTNGDFDLEALDSFDESDCSHRVFKHVDGIKFLNHQGGCGGTRQDSETLGRLLAAYADHPNVGGVTLLSLGCQHLQVDDFRSYLLQRNPAFDKPLLVFEQQGAQNEESLIKNAIKQTLIGLSCINKIVRTPAALNKLTIGVKCGGSDGFSGISANPAVGYVSDLLVSLRGKILLAEFPELCGVEQQIIDRCVDERTANKFISLMKGYEEKAKKAGSGFDMNPSPGNIRDGLITDAMKSAGAAKKGGTSPVAGVLDYTEQVTRSGLSLVCTPGNDVEATTGQAAAGATLILFTTGLGTPTGNPVCPTIKISSNTSLATRMADIVDMDAGGIISEKKTIAQMGEDILEFCILVASGEVIPKAVQMNQDDFIPWKRGVSL